MPVLVGLAALFGFVTGVATVVYNVAQVSLRQAITPTRMQGRMNATMRWFVWGTIPIGGILGGVLGTLLGVREAVLIGALGEMLAILPVLFSPVRGDPRDAGAGRLTTQSPATTRSRAVLQPSPGRRRPASGPGRRARGRRPAHARSPRRRGG